MFTMLVSIGRAFGRRVPAVSVSRSLPLPPFPDGRASVDDAVRVSERLAGRELVDGRVGDSLAYYVELGRLWDTALVNHSMFCLDERSRLLQAAAHTRVHMSRRKSQRLRAQAIRLAGSSERMLAEEISSHVVCGSLVLGSNGKPRPTERLAPMEATPVESDGRGA